MSSNRKHLARRSPCARASVLLALGAASAVAHGQVQSTNLGFHPDRAGELTSRSPACLWEERTPSPITRFEAASAVVDGRLFVFGGFKNQILQVSQRVDIYDPQTDNWSQGTDLPAELTHAGVAVDGTDVWFAGGFVGDNPLAPNT